MMAVWLHRDSCFPVAHGCRQQLASLTAVVRSVLHYGT